MRLRAKVDNDAVVTAPLIVVVDTREQVPWTFDNLQADGGQGRLLVPQVRGTLDAGDYSIVGQEERFRLERKSLEDLYATLGQRREQFENEHARLMSRVRQHQGYAAVIVESSLQAALFDPPLASRLNPKSVFRTFVHWSLRYEIPWHWADGRAGAQALAYRLMEAWLKHVDVPF